MYFKHKLPKVTAENTENLNKLKFLDLLALQYLVSNSPDTFDVLYTLNWNFYQWHYCIAGFWYLISSLARNIFYVKKYGYVSLLSMVS